ncbi:MAG TPA: DUF2092 domain-containing protein [Solidesulfovibrio magneticus]|nr:DUF2092 domain-containing protein [Solidesulfovibrio magneticus]
MRRILWTAVLCAWLAAVPAGRAAAQTAPAEPAKAADITPEAKAPVEAMCAFLAGKKTFTFSVEINEEQVYPSGQTVQLTRFADVAVKRPDKLYSRVTGDERDREMVYDGKTVTMADYDRGVYAVVDAPPTIDAAMEMLADTYGIVAPLSDLLYADPCKAILAHVRTGDCVGAHTAGGAVCDHLAFTQKNADWQLWVEKDKTPLPRKVVITDKNVMGWPQYAAVFSDWDMTPKLPADLFTFKPGTELRRIELKPLAEGQAAQGGGHE